MDWKALAGPLTDAGLSLLGAAIGGPAGAVAATVGRQIAKELGVSTPAQAIEAIRYEPDAVPRLQQLEQESAEQLALLAQEQRNFSNILARDSDKGWFWDAWRPATMWLIGVLWLWSLMIVPTLNATTTVSIPMPPFDSLMALTGIYMALYMGGNTVLRAIEKRGG